LVSAVLVVFVSDVIARLGPARVLVGGIACLAAAAALIGRVGARPIS
jgi:hypothetical protein